MSCCVPRTVQRLQLKTGVRDICVSRPQRLDCKAAPLSFTMCALSSRMLRSVLSHGRYLSGRSTELGRQLRLANVSASHSFFSTALFPQAGVHRTDQHNSTRGSSKQQRISIALALGTAASSAIVCTAVAPRNGVSFAEFSTVATQERVTEEDSEKKSVYAGPDISIVLYQFEVCPFCNKVRAYLDYHNIPYKVIEVDPLRKTELKQFSADYRKVPIAIVDGKQVNGSAAIIEHVYNAVNGESAQIRETEQKWVKWVDDYFIHLISPNIYRTPRESLQTFEYIADNAKFSPWQRATIRYSGAAAMYFVGKRLKKKYNIDDERAAIYDALQEWVTAISQNGGKFLAGGDVPGIADLSVYGVLKAIQTFDTFSDLRNNNSALCEWYDRTQAAVGETSITERG